MARNKPRTVDEYLASVKPDQRGVLEKLRQTVLAAAPGAEECISYGLAAFRFRGRSLLAFGAWVDHCALYPMSPATQKVFQDRLRAFETSKGTIRFTPDRPLPTDLVKKLVRARMAENAHSRPGRRNPGSREEAPGAHP